jgi:hypothetical protein
METSVAETGPTTRLPSFPAATRVQRPGWRDPRIGLGLALVAGCVLVGSRVMAAADETVPVWAAVRSLPAGAEVSAGDLELRRVHVADVETRGLYLTGTAPPDGATVARDVAAGELLTSAALSDGPRVELVEVPLGVAPEALPATVRDGSVVDVWVTPEGARAGDGVARQVLDDVVVVDLPRAADGFAPQGARQLIVGVPAARSADLGQAIGAVSTGHVVVTVTRP